MYDIQYMYIRTETCFHLTSVGLTHAYSPQLWPWTWNIDLVLGIAFFYTKYLLCMCAIRISIELNTVNFRLFCSVEHQYIHMYKEVMVHSFSIHLQLMGSCIANSTHCIGLVCSIMASWNLYKIKRRLVPWSLYPMTWYCKEVKLPDDATIRNKYIISFRLPVNDLCWYSVVPLNAWSIVMASWDILFVFRSLHNQLQVQLPVPESISIIDSCQTAILLLLA